jgi:methionine-rich copper-binding protein CopC
MRRAHFTKALLILGSFWFFTRTAYAHALLVKATPAPYHVVNGPDVSIRLQFNGRIDVKRSRLVIISANGEDRKVQIGRGSAPDRLDSKLTGVAGGVYVLRWQVVSADGQISRGQVPFRVR